VTAHAPAARVVSRVPLHPDWTLQGTQIVAGALVLGLRVLVGRRGGDEDGWVGAGFGVRRPRAVATFQPGEDGRCVYAIAAPAAEDAVRALYEMIK
jgi:hypothetical protein